jgi:hypothetical protein
MNWKLDSGVLTYNDNQIETVYNSHTNLVLKVSPDGRFAAVCNISSYYADIYKAVDDDQQQSTKRYPKYFYSLRRNTYKTKGVKYLLEFFASPVEPSKTLFIFNLEHGKISVIDAETGREMHTDHFEDKFIIDYKIVYDKVTTKRFLYLDGWYWGPSYFTSLYDIDTLLTSANVESVKIECDVSPINEDNHFKLNKNDEIEIFSRDSPHFKSYTVDYFFNNEETIRMYKNNVKLTNQITSNKNNMFHKLCYEENEGVTFNDNAKTVLHQLLSTPMSYSQSDIITCSCKGNRNSKELIQNLYKLVENITLNDTNLNYLIPRILSQGYVQRFHQLSEIDMKISLERRNLSLNISIKQKMKLMAGNNTLYEVDAYEPCYITLNTKKLSY